MDLIAYMRDSDETNPFKIIGFTNNTSKVVQKILSNRGFVIGAYVFKDIQTGYLYTEHSNSMISPTYFIIE